VFRTALREAEPRGPTSGLLLLSGIDGDWVENLRGGQREAGQANRHAPQLGGLSRKLLGSGRETCLGTRPGNRLNRMAARVFPNGSARSTDEFRTLAGLRGWLARAND
jgi:[acyl-carrier-protein] S-malonyltransferase